MTQGGRTCFFNTQGDYQRLVRVTGASGRYGAPWGDASSRSATQRSVRGWDQPVEKVGFRDSVHCPAVDVDRHLRDPQTSEGDHLSGWARNRRAKGASGAPFGHGRRPQPRFRSSRFRFWPVAISSASTFTFQSLGVGTVAARASPWLRRTAARPRPSAWPSPSRRPPSRGRRARGRGTRRTRTAGPAAPGCSRCRQP